MGPDSLREVLVYNDGEADLSCKIGAHADAWEQQLRDEFDRGWAQGRKEHLNPVLEARIEALEEEVDFWKAEKCGWPSP
jgi:hypothetical protein